MEEKVKQVNREFTEKIGVKYKNCGLSVNSGIYVVKDKDATPQKAVANANMARKKAEDTKSLKYAVLNGIREYAKEATKELLKTKDSMEIVNEILIPALDQVGNDFESGKLFLPQLIQSATTAQEAFEVIKEIFEIIK